MQYSLSFAIAVLGSLITLVRSAPTAALDAATLLQNGQEAQQLNSIFQNLTATDPCSGKATIVARKFSLSNKIAGQVACVQNSISTCANGTWDTSKGRCANTQNCFAIPSVRAGGVVSLATEKFEKPLTPV